MAVADCVKISFEACIWISFLYWISLFWVSNLGGVYLKGHIFGLLPWLCCISLSFARYMCKLSKGDSTCPSRCHWKAGSGQLKLMALLWRSISLHDSCFMSKKRDISQKVWVKGRGKKESPRLSLCAKCLVPQHPFTSVSSRFLLSRWRSIQRARFWPVFSF